MVFSRYSPIFGKCTLYASIYSFASRIGIPRSCESEKGPIPYMIPKLTAFARLRISGVTISSGTWNTEAAVEVCTSAPLWNAASMVSSPDTCASSRSSICE